MLRSVGEVKHLRVWDTFLENHFEAPVYPPPPKHKTFLDMRKAIWQNGMIASSDAGTFSKVEPRNSRKSQAGTAGGRLEKIKGRL